MLESCTEIFVKDEQIENLKMENEKINKKLFEFERNNIEKEEQFENLKVDNKKIHIKLSEIEKKDIEKDNLLDNIVNSMLEKFRKLEEKIYDVDCDKSEMTFCNPYLMEQPCGECEFVCNSGMELENHVKEKHETNKVNGETEKDESVIIDNQTETPEEIFQCDLCDFKTTNNPGLMSHKTKMHKNAHPCDQCSETFDSRKKLKSHIYCIHSGKYKTLAQSIDECNP